MILPLCDPTKSGIDQDPRKGFYTEVANFSNLYTRYEKQIGQNYGHYIPEVTMPEYAHFDGIFIRDGLFGGNRGATYLRWDKKSAAYDRIISNSLSFERYTQLKRIMKLNDNRVEKKRDEEGYNPCAKYDLIYSVIVSNVRALTKYGDLDLTGDETSWAHQGYGEKGTGNLFRMTGKPGISKGGQTLIISATKRIRPYWYQHRHKFTKRFPNGFSSEGPAEVHSCIDALENLIVRPQGSDVEPEECNTTMKKIFMSPPHLTFDNYFSGEAVFHYAGQKRFGLLMTTRRDRLPKGIPAHYGRNSSQASSKMCSVRGKFIQEMQHLRCISA